MAVVGDGGFVIISPYHPATHQLGFSGTVTDIEHWRVDVDGGLVRTSTPSDTLRETTPVSVGSTMTGHIDYATAGTDPLLLTEGTTAVYSQRIKDFTYSFDGVPLASPELSYQKWGDIHVTDDSASPLFSIAGTDGLFFSSVWQAHRGSNLFAEIHLTDSAGTSLQSLDLPTEPASAVFALANADISGRFVVREQRENGDVLAIAGNLDAVDVSAVPLPPAVFAFALGVGTLWLWRRLRGVT